MTPREFQEKYGYSAREHTDITESDYLAAKEKQTKYIEKHGHGSLTFQTIIDIWETNRV
jgi:hypothetical protein